MRTTVDIVIPTLLQDLELLHACLESLSQLIVKNIDVKVHIICNLAQPANTEEKGKQLKRIQEKTYPFPLNWIWTGENVGFAAAMNTGMLLGKGELIFCLNDDTTVEPNALLELVATQKESDTDMVASTIYLSSTSQIDSQGFTFFWRGKAETLGTRATPDSARTDYWLTQPHFFSVEKKDHETFFQEPFGPDAAACLYTRKLIEQTSGFTESFFAYLEDVDLALRARQLGMTCALAEKAVIHHHKHSTSKHWKSFKHRQDFANWWRICLKTYSGEVWAKFWPIIFLERGRNLSAYLKSLVL